MLAIPNQRMDLIIGAAEVGALLVGTGEALGVHADGGHLAGFSPRARDATSVGPDPTTDEGEEARRQAGPSSRERGFRRRCSLRRSLAAPLDGAGPGWS